MQAWVFTAIMVAFAFAFAPVLEAAPRPDGGPTKLAITAPQSTTFFMLARSELAVAKLCDPSQAGFIQRRFPNLPYSRFPNSAGSEAALEVGLETCAATVRRQRLYSQFEAVIRFFLPTVNLARETRNY
jgi:hypothetical protein